MITVATVCRSGGVYTPEWVLRLYAQVRKHMPSGVPFKFRVLSDTPLPWFFDGAQDQAVAWAGFDVVPFSHDWPGWWSKIELFRPGIFPDDRILYFDLDTVITGSLEPLLDYWGEFAALSDFYEPALAASGVMMWRNGQVPMYELALAHPPTFAAERSDRWWNQHLNAQRLQDIFPGMFGSYKADELEAGPAGFSVVCFHGYPKQSDLPGTWVDEKWQGR